MKTWRVIDYGEVPPALKATLAYYCVHCGQEALLPVVGKAVAQLGEGLLFDVGGHAIPRLIECRNCHRRMEAC